MNQNKFSVLISVYKKENSKFFNEALESITNQKLIPNQIVIVCDGELTRELNDVIYSFNLKFKDNIIIDKVELPRNVGLGKALSIGINSCKFEWIFRMDSDDISLENRFSIMMKHINNNQHIDVLGSNINEVDSDNKEIFSTRKVYRFHENIKKNLVLRNPMNHVSVAYKKSAVLKAGNYPDFLYFEDYFLWIKMFSMGFIFENIDEVLVNVRVGKNMIGRRKGFFYFKQEYKMQKILLNYGFSNYYYFFRNLIIRCLPRFLPSLILEKLYKLSRILWK